jgi:hypothetical protein
LRSGFPFYLFTTGGAFYDLTHRVQLENLKFIVSLV